MSKKEKETKAKPHSLESVVWREFGVELNKVYQGADWGGELSTDMLEYAARDARILLPLTNVLGEKIDGAGLERVWEIERRATPAVAWMQNAGLPFDATVWSKHIEGVEERVAWLIGELDEMSPYPRDRDAWNWDSPAQVKEVFTKVGIELPNTKKETLARCNHSLATTLLEYREADKVVKNFGPKFIEAAKGDGRIYASWRQIGAVTGRMSCSDPPLQQLPKADLRRHVCAPEGRLIVSADYSQIEVRIAARISGDERMLKAYGGGEDLHAATARSILSKGKVSKDEREIAKAVNFGLLYGQRADGLRAYARNVFGIKMTLEEAQSYREAFFSTYPGLRSWHEREERELRQGNAETRTLAGRRRIGIINFRERVNSPVQGTGADGLKLALALLWERRMDCPGTVPITCVHDEIVVECNEEDAEKSAAWLERAMKDAMNEVLNEPFDQEPYVPIEVEVEISERWGT